MGYELVGKVWDLEGFEKYISKNKSKLKWASSVTNHHTGSPNLAQRPKGWTIQHMKNLQHFYQKQLGWSAGPHLFTDEDQIFGMSGLHRRGVHAKSFNAYSIGVEGLGNYDSEDPYSGRGLEVFKTTAATFAILLEGMGVGTGVKTVKFHRFDKRTSKSCPGSKYIYQSFLDEIRRVRKEGYDNYDTSSKVLEETTAPQDAPTIPDWDEFVAHAGIWFAPVTRFLKELGTSESDIYKTLKRKNGKFVLGSNELELAYYDKEKQETWAPVSEILNINKVVS